MRHKEKKTNTIHDYYNDRGRYAVYFEMVPVNNNAFDGIEENNENTV